MRLQHGLDQLNIDRVIINDENLGPLILLYCVNGLQEVRLDRALILLLLLLLLLAVSHKAITLIFN